MDESLEIEISGRPIGHQHPPYIIAEIGQNHNGDVYTATRMCSMAVKAGCDAVKFQLRSAEDEIVKEQLLRQHPNEHAAFAETYGGHRAALDFDESDLRHVANRIRYNEWPIHWFATPCYQGAVEILERLHVPAYKIASKDLTNLPLVSEAASTKKPIILSTGMDGLPEIADALNHVYQYHDQVVLMHCVSKYPCPDGDANLLAIETLAEEFGCLIGYSDHTVGIQAASLAVAAGAVMIEKHITLSRAMKGSDHAAACEQDGLDRLVRDCQNVNLLFGSGSKSLSATREAREKLRGSLVYARPLSKGETVSFDDLAYKAPGTGLKYSEAVEVVNRVIKRDVNVDEQVDVGDVL